MTTSLNQSKVFIVGPNKGQENIKSSRQIAMVANVDVGQIHLVGVGNVGT